MRQELTDKLVTKYPLLYQDRNASLHVSLMAFGFEVGDGWYDLIDTLSSKLEPLIQQYIKDNDPVICSFCCCKKEAHFAHLSKKPGKCLSVLKRKKIQIPRINIPWNVIPIVIKTPIDSWKRQFNYKIYLWGSNVMSPINKMINVCNKVLTYFFHDYVQCSCEKYEAFFPRAAQVKEKFAGLRFYMTSETEEMSKLIDKAEAASYKICDRCGGPGETLRAGMWLHASCETCMKKADKDYIKEQSPTDSEDI